MTQRRGEWGKGKIPAIDVGEGKILRCPSLQELAQSERERRRTGEVPLEGMEAIEIDAEEFEAALHEESESTGTATAPAREIDESQLLYLRRELVEIRELLAAGH